MSIKVTTKIKNLSIAKVKAPPKVKVTTKAGVFVAQFLDELADVDTTGVSDKYVIMYDAAVQKYLAVNPDKVLSASATEELLQPGLPTDFVDTLDVDLDDRIDLDAGTW